MRDLVTPELRAAVLDRDRGCVARLIDCHHGRDDGQDCHGRLTLDHVKDQLMIGKRAPSDMAHLVTLCEGHHLWTGWATSHRPELRRYLKENADARLR